VLTRLAILPRAAPHGPARSSRAPRRSHATPHRIFRAFGAARSEHTCNSPSPGGQAPSLRAPRHPAPPARFPKGEIPRHKSLKEKSEFSSRKLRFGRPASAPFSLLKPPSYLPLSPLISPYLPSSAALPTRGSPLTRGLRPPSPLFFSSPFRLFTSLHRLAFSPRPPYLSLSSMPLCLYASPTSPPSHLWQATTSYPATASASPRAGSRVSIPHYWIRKAVTSCH
jgi:hypothetical protein